MAPPTVFRQRGERELDALGEPARVDLMILLHHERTGNTGAQQRFEHARCANGQGFNAQPIGQLHAAQVGERLPVGRFGTNVHGSGSLVSGCVGIHSE